MADENFANILMDVAVLWSLNIRTVLVHGASVLIRAMARESGVTPSDLEGSGVTDAETLKLALTASNRLTHETLEGLAAADLRAATPNAVVALSPLTDVSFSGDSIRENESTDIMLKPVMKMLNRLPRFIKSWWVLWTYRVRPGNPVASPLLGDLSNLPPPSVRPSGRRQS